MVKHTLSAEPRTVKGRDVKKLRVQKIAPANVFGKKIESLNVQVSDKEFIKLFKSVGESTLIYLEVNGEKESRPVLVSEVTRHPVSGQILHITFHQVDLKEKVTANVTVKLSGESPAEKEKLGILVQQLDEIEIEALPTDMPENITVDISILETVGTSIIVRDLKLDSAKLAIKTDLDTIVVKIEELAKEEVVAPPPTPEVAVGETAATEETVASPEATTPVPEK
jgi:large subunit ribosomal protein L25